MVMPLDYNTTGKRGVLVIGTPRCGSHALCHGLYNSSTEKNSKFLGEILKETDTPDHTKILEYWDRVENENQNNFVYASIVQLFSKTWMSAFYSDRFDDYIIINLRRRNKVKQYMSWCVFRAQMKSSIIRHSPTYEEYRDFLLWKTTLEDIEMFMTEQLMDYALKSDFVVYYEDIDFSSLGTEFKKNHNLLNENLIMSDPELVNRILLDFKYRDEK